jgi:formylglycine-generating enzyme required for sulfatase activity
MRTGFCGVAAALFAAVVVFVICCTATSSYADGRRRVAVVVGIAKYQALPTLPNATRDAEAVAKRLRERHGFGELHLLVSERGVGREEIESKWDEVVSGLKPGDTVVFYYAGHAIELKGRNYLVTSSAVFPEDAEETGLITGASVDLQDMVERLGGHQHEQGDDSGIVGIFILDACRENPFEWDWARKDARGVGLGPSAMPPQEMFVMYSAGIGQKALDGKDGNSPFIKALLARLDEDNLALSDLAQEVRSDVIRDAFENYNGYAQTPAFYDQLHFRRTIGGTRQPRRFALDNRPFNFAWQLQRGDALVECPSCPDMVVLDGGTYPRGSPDDEPGRNRDEGPQREVTVKRFAIGKFEVTNRQWDQCVSEPLGGFRCPGALRTARPEDGGKPVTGVSWPDANAYAQWLSTKTGASYRLPTESEWEYAARAGTKTPYSFDASADRKAICRYANGADSEMGVLPHTYRHCSDGVGRGVAHVGRYRDNPWGLHDMHGNVWEWTLNCWHPSYNDAPMDDSPSSASNERCGLRVARGGSWRSTESALRSAVRNAFPQDHRRATLGFRVARDIK